MTKVGHCLTKFGRAFAALQRIAVCAALAATMPAKAQDSPFADLNELRWVFPEADKLAILTSQPPDCLRPEENPDTRYRVSVGKMAFNSPLLFGGTAARNGLSCAACHRNGHDNPAFFLKGLSSEPGTADVTTALFSKVREDNKFNPKTIPTLIDISKTESDHETADDGLRAFIKSAVVDEFQSVAPAELIDALAVYVAHLDSEFCEESDAPIDFDTAWDDVEETLVIARDALLREDKEIADFGLAHARLSLGKIHARFGARSLEPHRLMLIEFSAAIKRSRDLLRTDDDASRDVLALIETAEELQLTLRQYRRLTLFSPTRLKHLLLQEQIRTGDPVPD